VTELIADLRKVPVLRVAVPFAAGIPAAAYTGAGFSACLQGAMEAQPVCLGFLLFLFFLFFLLFLVVPATSGQQWGLMTRGLLLLIAFFFLGTVHHNASRRYRVEEEKLDRQEGYLEGIVVDGSVKKNNRCVVRLKATAFMNDSIRTYLCEFVQLYLPEAAEIRDLQPGEHLLVRGRLNRIRNNGNPGEFDYAGYMERKRTRFQVFVSDSALFRVLRERGTAKGYGPAGLRQRIIGRWDREDPDVAVLSALTLGYKSLLDQETKAAFSDAGAMHLLAVSGLHVGMIWWILEKLIRVPGGRSAWRRLKLIVIVAVLWGYAAVTGFPDSVTRSVTMFSLLTLSKSIQRNSNIYNTLLVSAFLLLLLKPSRIMEPGFQLSYVAVTGIVAIQPQLEKTYSGVHWLFRRILDLVSVSIAAQVATLPLVLTYFQQFPVWFMLTNLAAIPLVSIILALFVVFIPFLIFFPEWQLCSEILLWIAGLLNKVVSGIASLPGAVIHDISPDPLVMYLLTGILISTCLLVYYRQAYFMVLALLLGSAALSVPVLRGVQLDGKSSVTIFNLDDATLISQLQGTQRVTCLFPADSVPDAYLMDYVQSLSGSPPGVRTHRVFSLQWDDPSCDASLCRIAEGVWGIRTGTRDVLIAGDCHRKILQQALHAYHWHLVVFRRGIPLYGIAESLESFSGQVVGDGTLMFYERNSLRQQVPSIWLTDEAGVLVLKNAPGRPGSKWTKKHLRQVPGRRMDKEAGQTAP
jgi:competence protein ComEC